MPINDPEKSENMRKSIRVYSGSSNRPLAQKIAEYLGVELSGLTLKQFATGEIYARYDETVRGPISKLCREYKIKAEELLVIHDELDIPAGDVRVKVGGGHAGHNGLRSIIDKMGSRDFSRIRTGIGNPPGKMAVADYVLKQLRAREAEDFQDTCARAADAAGLAIVHGVVYARDHVNGAASANGKH